VVIVVLDGFGPEFARADLTPRLLELAADGGGVAPAGGLGDLVASTAPGHATLFTGVPPPVHGVLAGKVFGPHGQPVEPRVAVPTVIDRAVAAGRSTAVIVGDPDILTTVHGIRAHTHWPPGGRLGPETDQLFGYARDAATLEALLPVLEDGTELVIAQLNDADTACHASGIEGSFAIDSYRAADAAVAQIAEALAPDWERTLLAVVSDHRHETTISREPVALREALRDALGTDVQVIEDGSGALVRGAPGPRVWRAALRCAGVAGVQPLFDASDTGQAGDASLDEDLIVWAEPGRGFGNKGEEVVPLSLHGNITTRPTLAVVAGGHPLVAPTAAAIRASPPPLRSWAGVAAAVLGFPPA